MKTKFEGHTKTAWKIESHMACMGHGDSQNLAVLVTGPYMTCSQVDAVLAVSAPDLLVQINQDRQTFRDCLNNFSGLNDGLRAILKTRLASIDALLLPADKCQVCEKELDPAPEHIRGLKRVCAECGEKLQ